MPPRHHEQASILDAALDLPHHGRARQRLAASIYDGPLRRERISPRLRRFVLAFAIPGLSAESAFGRSTRSGLLGAFAYPKPGSLTLT